MNTFLILLSSALLVQAPAPKPAAAPTTTRGASSPASPKPAAQAPPRQTTPAQRKPAAPAAAITTDEQKAIYALGLSVYQSLRPFALSPTELELFKRGITDAASGKPAGKLEEWEPKIDELARA